MIGRRGRFQNDFERLRQGSPTRKLDSLDGKDLVRWEQAKALWEKQGMAPSQTASLAAYDYERIAYLARSCFSLGYLTETELWRCLAWVSTQSRSAFANWNDYAASFIFGRAATFDDGSEKFTLKGIVAAYTLLHGQQKYLKRPHLWQRYLLDGITVPSDITMPEYLGVASTSQANEPLSGLGALSARVNDERSNALAIGANRPDESVSWLAKAWNIADAATADRAIEWLLKSGSRERYENVFSRVVDCGELSQLEDVSATQFLNVRQTIERIVKAGISENVVIGCRSMLAYDLERAAYIVRVAAATGYITESNAWSYLRRLSLHARRHFVSWENYLVSFVLAQAFLNSNPEMLLKIIQSGAGLLKIESPFDEYVSPWRKYPMHCLPGVSKQEAGTCEFE
ncbi:hypothetical protein BN2476_460001 [Paraburkholderia piptadeniae]|uniref:DUF1266 domain-containing protein n=1 Tax=Paraburkholderia piptadeniae TaxID=1701573 RepID=A0A1N7SDH8_9BURK|nr:hypothetical protein BN2476_460001 [Paraburkholderia piptadeniae]